VEPHLFAALRSGFDAAARDDAPVDQVALSCVRTAIDEAAVGSMPGLPIILRLRTGRQLNVLSDCFEVGGECHPAITDFQWDAITALLEQAARATAP
jgi:hypothetical protein